MLYPSLRFRAFQISERSALSPPRCFFTVRCSTRNHATNSPCELEDNEIDHGTQEPKAGSGNHEAEGQGISANHDLLSDQDETEHATGELCPIESSITSNQPIFHATYTQNDRQTLRLPELPSDWDSRDDRGHLLNLRRRNILRAAFLEAASSRLHRRSQIISRLARSEAKLKTLVELLYPYRRRPPNWDRNIYALFHFRKSTVLNGSHIPGLSISPLAADWCQDLLQDGHISEASEIGEELRAQQERAWEFLPDTHMDRHMREARIRWSQVPQRQKMIRWPHIMLKCLTVSTEQALRFLLVTDIKPFPTFESVMDVLLYLKRARAHEINANPELGELYQQVLSRQRQPTRWIYHIERKHLDLLLEDCSADQGKDIFEKLLDANIYLSYHCMLIFMDFFTRIGEIDLALKALNGIDPDVRLRSDQRLLSRCTNLLKLDSISFDENSPNFRILPQILKAGVKTNLVLHNIVLKNAVNMGASIVAWDLFHYLRDHDLPTDARTYLVLMQDALARQDVEGLEGLITAIWARNDLIANPHLIAFTLTVIRVQGQESKLSPTVVFSDMLALYGRTFSRAPLLHLEMVSGSSPSAFNQHQVVPDMDTLAYVVQSYILAQQSSTVVQSLWDRTEQLHSEEDQLALGLAQCLPFYDGFIAFFARKMQTLPKCLQIVQLMLDRKISPSATTWGILAVAFTRYGQLEAAREVDTLMYRQGLHRTEKTTRLMMELTPQPARPDFVSMDEDFGKQPEGTSLDVRSPSTDFEQESQFEEEDFIDATASNMPQLQRESPSLPNTLIRLDSIITSNSAYGETFVDGIFDHAQLTQRGEAPNDTHDATTEPGLVFAGSRFCSPATSDFFFTGVDFRSTYNASFVWSRLKAARDEEYGCWEKAREREARERQVGSTRCEVRNRQGERSQDQEIGEIESGGRVEERAQSLTPQEEETQAQQIQEQVTEAGSNQEPAKKDARHERIDDQKPATINKQIKKSERKESENPKSTAKKSNAKPFRGRFTRIRKYESEGTNVKVRKMKSDPMKVKIRRMAIFEYLTLNRRRAELSKYLDLKGSKELVSKLQSVETIPPGDRTTSPIPRRKCP
ncbi:hypothetical protein EPUS_01407 [Endocarpon pusillum Z07020]|uniref:Uncharacterized protein n=1 Tax=Endocarpon pusillum (strain Z07020 / HMAS-L-300199) TaxID=1263415 RepID=U1I287_ENDPU|nr:uncharacterized protein EPUS_01407 [Endocarpon pusillum Z07020]ERF76074.1 hypothetical protein EPUS_01407 [Endocarpon pusillum Z07020]